MNELLEKVAGAIGFDWDTANIDKNWEKHAVRFSECEEVFFRAPLLGARPPNVLLRDGHYSDSLPAVSDPSHSRQEERFAALGRTALGRPLSIVFTSRAERIRVISAREMSRKERQEFLRHEEA